MPRSSSARRVLQPPAKEQTFAAEVVEVTADGLVVRRKGEVGPVVDARCARIAGYRASVGDVVIITWLGGEAIAVGVLEAAEPPSIASPDGATARVVDGGLELADAEGRLLVRYVDGTAEIAPPRGDLRIAAPHGRVQITAGLDVAIEASRDVTVSAERSAETKIVGAGADRQLASRFRVDAKGATIAAPELEVRSRRARITAGLAEAVVREIKTSATRIETAATTMETQAERISVRAKSMAEDVAELLETKAGRIRSLVRGAFTLRSKSTSLKSKDDTAVDGRRVLLG